MSATVVRIGGGIKMKIIRSAEWDGVDLILSSEDNGMVTSVYLDFAQLEEVTEVFQGLLQEEVD